jgi:hypothetical protein
LNIHPHSDYFDLLFLSKGNTPLRRMTDSNKSPILGWVASVKSDEEKQHLTSHDGIEVDSDYNPDNEHRAPVPSYNDIRAGNTPADGKWGLAKKEQRDATDAHKREQRLIKKREQRRRKKMRQRASTQNNGAFTSVLPLPTTATLPNTAIPSFITISREFELKPLEFNSTTPSTSTGPADGNMTGRVPKRKRHHYAYNTYPSAITHPVPGKSYVDAATQTEPEHICIGDASARSGPHQNQQQQPQSLQQEPRQQLQQSHSHTDSLPTSLTRNACSL